MIILINKVGLIIFSALFIRNLFSLLFNTTSILSKNFWKRKKQLDFSGRTQSISTEDKLVNIVDKVTDPVMEHIYPNIKFKDLNRLEKQIANKMMLARWSKISPKQFIAVSIITMIIGLSAFLLMMSDDLLLGTILGSLIAFAPYILLNASTGGRKDKLLKEFPDFIRMTQVFLADGQTFKDSLIKSSALMSDDWKDIIEQMAVIAGRGEIEASLDVLLQEFNILEVKEFVAVVKLSIAQGGDLSDAFKSQADRIAQIEMDLKDAEIEKRKMYGTLIQTPLLMAILIIIALPMVSNLIGFLGESGF